MDKELLLEEQRLRQELKLVYFKASQELQELLADDIEDNSIRLEEIVEDLSEFS